MIDIDDVDKITSVIEHLDREITSRISDTLTTQKNAQFQSLVQARTLLIDAALIIKGSYEYR